MIRWMLSLLLLSPPVFAMSWVDWWYTPDQQAARMMNKGEYQAASERFARKDWAASAAFRAKAWSGAAGLFESLQTADGFYNAGNALARAGQLEKAIKAYDKALAIEPGHADAIYNRKIVEALLKKQQEQKKQEQNKQEQNKQEQNKQEQNKQEQNKQEQNKQEQDKQEQNKQEQNKQEQDKQEQDKQEQNKQEQNKQEQNKQEQNRQEQNRQEQNRQEQDRQEQDRQKAATAQSLQDQETEQTNAQWLQLVPDDPGGLLREKFLRDHWRKQRGWNR